MHQVEPLPIEPWVEGLQIADGSHEQTGANEQQQREGDLRGHEDLSSLPSPAAGHAASARLERRREVFGRANGGHRPEDKRGGDRRRQREDQCARVGLRLEREERTGSR